MGALLDKLLPDDEQLVPEKVAAVVLGDLNPKTLANWRWKGTHPDLEYIRIGRSIRYRMGVLKRFKEQHTVGRCDDEMSGGRK